MIVPPPELMGDDELAGSWVPANCGMNRGRGLSGRDGYNRLLGMDVVDTLSRLLTAGPQRTVRWLDLCCGEGRALLEGAALLRDRGLSERVTMVGVDLVDHVAGQPPPEVSFVTASATTWRPEHSFDLITCVHGMHYVGDKLGMLRDVASWLRADRQFAANFDATSIRLDSVPAG